MKLRNDIESVKSDLFEKDLELQTVENKLLEVTKVLNDEQENKKKLESRLQELNQFSETLKNERDAALKEVELKNKRLLVVNERKHDQTHDANSNDIQIILNDFVENDSNESPVNHDLKSKENDLEISRLQEANNNLSEQLVKLKLDLENASKLQNLLGKERELQLSQTGKLHQELEAAKLTEQQLRKDNDNIMQQLKKARIDMENSTKLEEDRILKASETEKRYTHTRIIIYHPLTFIRSDYEMIFLMPICYLIDVLLIIVKKS
jgi:hypothetical protein